MGWSRLWNACVASPWIADTTAGFRCRSVLEVVHKQAVLHHTLSLTWFGQIQCVVLCMFSVGVANEIALLCIAHRAQTQQNLSNQFQIFKPPQMNAQ